MAQRVAPKPGELMMYDVLIYVFEHFFTPDACPSPEDLADQLVAEGFEHNDIHDAMSWLYRLAETTEISAEQPAISSNATRVYTLYEQHKLGTEGIRLLHFLERTGALSPSLREIVINCALDTPDEALDIEEFRILALMVLWSQEHEMNHLLIDELLQDEGKSKSITLH